MEKSSYTDVYQRLFLSIVQGKPTKLILYLVMRQVCLQRRWRGIIESRDIRPTLRGRPFLILNLRFHADGFADAEDGEARFDIAVFVFEAFKLVKRFGGICLCHIVAMPQ